MNLVIILVIFFAVIENTSSHYSNEQVGAHDHHEDEIAGKLRYLPEFNVDTDVTNKWSKYIKLVQDANRQHLSTADKDKVLSPDWANATCATFLPLVESDLKFYENLHGAQFIDENTIEQMKKLDRNVHYQIVNHRLYRDKACMFPSRCLGVEHFLKLLLPHLPNMDLFINVRDYPQIGKSFPKNQQLPVFSFSKDVSGYVDITYPAWTFWSGGPALDIYPTGIGRWDLSRESILKKQSQLPWSKKADIAFFRGSRTSAQRDPIILLSRAKPHLVDAKYTKNQAWKSKQDTLGEEPAETVTFEDHCQFKYLFNAHGVAASFRLKHLFLCRSLVLNVQSNWIEFFYPPLKPWIHYVPISADFADTADVLLFLADNNAIAARIAKNGFEFIRQHLTMEAVQCYWRYLLEAYSSRLVAHRPSVPDQEMIEVSPSV